MDATFYKINHTSVDKVAPKLLEKAYATDNRVVVVCAPERLDAFDSLLWTYASQAFLPHGTSKDGRPQDQPIWVTDHVENPNKASILMIVDDTDDQKFPGAFDRLLYLWDSRVPMADYRVFGRIDDLKKSGIIVNEWSETADGKWTRG